MSKATEEQRQLWLLRVQDMEESGMTMAEWCREKNIPVSTMGYWKRMLKKDVESANTPCWLKVETAQGPAPVSRLQIPADSTANSGIIALKYSGFTVELPACCNSQQVFEMLQVLRML